MRRRARVPGRSLRARLVITVLVLFAVACTIIGVATALGLRSFLFSRLDQEVVSAATRFTEAHDYLEALGQGQLSGGPGPVLSSPEEYGDTPGGPGDSTFLGPAQRPRTLGVILSGDQVETAAVTDRHGSLMPVPSGDLTTLQTLETVRGGHPRTVTLSLGDYRVVAVPAEDGKTLVLGLPAGDSLEVLNRLIVIELIVIGTALTGAGIAAAVLVRRELRPLEEVATIAASVGELPLDSGEVELPERVPQPDPSTEVGQVGVALNRMLDNVEGAFEARHESETRLRQFIADASHELRTPLAAIRGYAELTRRDEQAIPQGTRHALGRISSQAERMSALVEDLLLLARLDAGRPLERRDVDLTRLLLDAVGDAYAAGPTHRWRLDLPDEPVIVTGDASRLTQVVTNLLANARTHTPPGTEVTTGMRVDQPESGRAAAVVTVHDTGPGIPAELVPHVFQRFARASASRTRAGNDTSSTGLGLAIVAAVVQAHHGQVAVTSRPGATTFQVRLPLERPPSARQARPEPAADTGSQPAHRPVTARAQRSR